MNEVTSTTSKIIEITNGYLATETKEGLKTKFVFEQPISDELVVDLREENSSLYTFYDLMRNAKATPYDK